MTASTVRTGRAILGLHFALDFEEKAFKTYNVCRHLWSLRKFPLFPVGYKAFFVMSDLDLSKSFLCIYCLVCLRLKPQA